MSLARSLADAVAWAFRPLDSVLRKLRPIWACVRVAGGVLSACRFSVLALIIGAAVLLLAPQGIDAARAVVDDNGGARLVGFLLAAAYWGFVIWAWGRAVVTTDPVPA